MEFIEYFAELQKQQLLKGEYQREVEEEQRLAADNARTDTDRGQAFADRQRHLGEERRKEYQQFLAQVRKNNRYFIMRKLILVLHETVMVIFSFYQNW